MNCPICQTPLNESKSIIEDWDIIYKPKCKHTLTIYSKNNKIVYYNISFHKQKFILAHIAFHSVGPKSQTDKGYINRFIIPDIQNILKTYDKINKLLSFL